MDPGRLAIPLRTLEVMTIGPRASAGSTDSGGIAQLVLDQLGYGMIACDRRMVVLTCTARASRVLGATQTSLLGRGLPPGLQASVREAVHNERPIRIEPAGGGRGAYLSAIEVEDRIPVVHVLWLRHEIVRQSDLARTLRARYELTLRDARLLLHLRRGHTNRQISERTGWAEATVRAYVHQLYGKLGVHSRGAAVALVSEILHPEE
jgi:DNA-binding CsgD family transcriptional regulator